jgi:osmotically-inducible protein OsmY
MLEMVMTIMMRRGRSLATDLLLIFLLGALAAACAATPISESTGGYIDDAAITGKVKTALAQDPKIGIRAAQIHVITYKGVVELSGFVDSDSEVAEAGSTAGQVAGVKSVQNSLIVKTQAAP